jgi:RNA polymerase sigma-70 factor (ECF subfamily)
MSLLLSLSTLSATGRRSPDPAPEPVADARPQDGRMNLAPRLGGQAAADARTDDAGLAARLRRGDEAALAEVYDAHAAAVHGVLTRLLGEASAQEATQDVFLTLWRRPETFDPGRASLRVYLLVMARSRGLDRLRARKVTLPLHDEEGGPLPFPDARQNPPERAEERHRRDRVRAALTQLSAPHRETVTRAFLQGQTREEIAAEMGIPVGTVKSRLKYALDHLRRVLAPEEVRAWLE